MLKPISLFNIKVSNLTMKETLNEIENAILSNRQIHYADLNAEKVVTLQHDEVLYEIYENTSIVNIDGQAVFWASNFLNSPVKERIAGVDLMGKIIELAAQQKYKVYLLGAEEEIIQRLASIYSNKFGNELIVGYRNGFFNIEDEKQIVSEINTSSAQILLVGITSPKKELFLSRNKLLMPSINFAMGVGGSFDVYAGKVKRAPLWMQKTGLEWFYRVIQEPQRMWKRYLIGNTKFIILLLKFKFKNL